jgi:hypothetical protein
MAYRQEIREKLKDATSPPPHPDVERLSHFGARVYDDFKAT